MVLKSKEKNYTDLLFMSMACADFFIGLISIPSHLVDIWFDSRWSLGYSLCMIWLIQDYSSCTVSLVNLVLISLQRLRLIVTPMKASEKMSTSKYIMILLVWPATYIPWGISILIISASNNLHERCTLISKFIFVLFANFFGYVLPSIFIVILNLLTIYFLRKKTKKFPANNNLTKNAIKSASLNPSSQNPTTLQTESNSNALSSAKTTTLISTPKINISKEKKALICLIVIATFVVACFSTFIVVWPLAAYCSSCVSLIVFQVSTMTIYFHSTLNPIILVIFHEKFRQKLKEIFNFFIKK